MQKWGRSQDGSIGPLLQGIQREKMQQEKRSYKIDHVGFQKRRNSRTNGRLQNSATGIFLHREKKMLKKNDDMLGISNGTKKAKKSAHYSIGHRK